MTKFIFGRGKLSPPSTHFIPLTYAVTWLAFGVSVDNRTLQFQLCNAPEWQVEDARLSLIWALNQVVDLASIEGVEVRGRFCPENNREAHSDYQKIAATEFHTFRRYDILIDGLRRGLGLSWAFYTGGLDTGRHDRSGDAYHDVLVRYLDVVDLQKARRPSLSKWLVLPKTGTAPDEDQIKAAMDELHDQGVAVRDLPKALRRMEGFKNVKSLTVFELAKGRYPRGRPRKEKG